MFTYQPLDLNEKRLWGLFYERLRNPGELLLATVASWSILTQGVPQHHGVLINLDVDIFPSFFDAPEGRVPPPDKSEESCGLHQVILLGADFEEKLFGFDHLFSADWGRDGQGALSFEYVEEHATGAIAVRSHGGPEPAEPEHEVSDDSSTGEAVDEDYPVHPDRVEYLIDHYRENEPESKWLLQHEEDDIVWMGRRLIGAGNGDIWVQGALLIRGVTDRPLLVGWMFARLVSDNLLDVEEFFVWPPYRGRGFGTALAGRTLLYASASHARRVRWIELNADSIVNQRVRSTFPAWASDFTWTASDNDLGWDVARVTEPIDILHLLGRLGHLHAPGGVHLLWTNGTVSVAAHHASPEFGVVLETDVPKPPAAIEVQGPVRYVSMSRQA